MSNRLEMNNAERIRASNRSVHKQEAPFYNAVHPEIFGGFEQSRITEDLDLIARLLKDDRVRALDIGCGTGNLTLKYLKQGYQVTAVDIAPEMLEILRAKAGNVPADQLELVVGDAEAVLADCPESEAVGSHFFQFRAPPSCRLSCGLNRRVSHGPSRRTDLRLSRTYAQNPTQLPIAA